MNQHPEDRYTIVHEHRKFTDTVGDAVIRIQDEAYSLGRERGRRDGIQATLTDAKILELAEPFGEFQFGDAQGDKRIAFARAVLGAIDTPTTTTP